MQQALWQGEMDIIKIQLGMIDVDTMLVQTNVLKEYCMNEDNTSAENKILDKKFLAAKREIKKQGRGMRKVELCEERLRIVPEGSEIANDLKKKITRICARHAKK
jgi:hypothetical protein